MKRYLLLTSVLALTACGGGSGGGGGISGGATPASPSTPALLNAATFLGDSASDNSEITNMASAVVVKNNSSYVSVARFTHDPDATSHSGYTIYKLDNVDFNLAGTEDAVFNFEINDDGRIVKALANGQEIPRDAENSSIFLGRIFQLVATSGSDEDLYTLVRNGPVTQQELNDARDEYLANHLHDGDVNLVTDEDRATVKWNYLEQKWTFNTSGRDKNLTYSDFGLFTSENLVKKKDVSIDANGNVVGTNKNSDHSTTMAFAGGYAINVDGSRATTLTPHVTPGETMRFSGKAVGRVHSSVSTDGLSGVDRAVYLDKYGIAYNSECAPSMEEAGRDSSRIFATENAHLTIDENGLQTLDMPFDDEDFYHVVVTKNGDGAVNFEFTPGDDTLDPMAPIGYQFLKESDVDSRYAPGDEMPTGTTNVTAKTFDPGFYGVGEPSEAAGTFRYKEVTQYNAHDSREFEFQGAYGMTVDTPTNP